MIVPDMWYVIASRYNVVLVLLSLKQNINFFPLRTQPHKEDSFVHRIICIDHVNGNHFVSKLHSMNVTSSTPSIVAKPNVFPRRSPLRYEDITLILSS